MVYLIVGFLIIVGALYITSIIIWGRNSWLHKWYWYYIELANEFVPNHPVTTTLAALSLFVAIIIIGSPKSPTFHLYCRDSENFSSSCGGWFVIAEFLGIFLTLVLAGLAIDLVRNKIKDSESKDNLYIGEDYGQMNWQRIAKMTFIGILLLVGIFLLGGYLI